MKKVSTKTEATRQSFKETAAQLLGGLVAEGFDFEAFTGLALEATAALVLEDAEEVGPGLIRLRKMGEMIQEAASTPPDQIVKEIGSRLAARFGEESQECHGHHVRAMLGSGSVNMGFVVLRAVKALNEARL